MDLLGGLLVPGKALVIEVDVDAQFLLQVEEACLEHLDVHGSLG